MHRWGHAGSTAASDGWISSHPVQVVYFAVSGGCSVAKWKVMRKSTCWARSLPFSYIITKIDFFFPSSHSYLGSIERYYIWNSCIFSLWNVYCTPDAAEQLGNMLRFIKKISSQPLSGLETRLFINEPFPSFDFPTYWDEWRQGEIPVSSWYFMTTVSSVVLKSQRHQTVKRWTNKKDSDWVKSLHLVCTESKELQSFVLLS